MFCEISLNISWWPFLGIAKDTDSPTFSILATLLVECAWWSLKCIDPSLMLSMPFNTNTFLFQMKFDASVLKYKIREKNSSKGWLSNSAKWWFAAEENSRKYSNVCALWKLNYSMQRFQISSFSFVEFKNMQKWNDHKVCVTVHPST